MIGSVEAQQIDSGVIIETLPELSLNSIGTPQGFESHIWQGSDSESLLALLNQIGTFPLTPGSEKIVIRLLTQDTTGSSLNDSKGLLKEDTFLISRLEALFRLGEWNAVLKLISLIPENQQSESIQKIKINTLLMKGETEQACNLLEQKEFASYTDKMRISCFLAREQKEKAILAYDIYQESGNKEDAFFNALGESVLRELPVQLPNYFMIMPEHVFLFSLLKKPTADWTKQSNGIKKTLSDLPTTDIPLRIQLGEQLHLTAEEMTRLYKLPLMNLILNTPSLKRASLFQKFKTAQGEPERVRILFEMMDSAQKDHLLFNLAPFFQELLNEISLQSEYEDIAFNAVQIYGLQDNLSAAAAWYQILTESKDARAQKQKLLLIPLMNHLGAGFPSDIDQLIRIFCPGKTDALCTHFWNIFPQQLQSETQFRQPVDLTMPLYGSLPNENPLKQGENLLKALLDLNRPNTDKQAILKFIKTTLPSNIGRQLDREALLFQ